MAKRPTIPRESDEELRIQIGNSLNKLSAGQQVRIPSSRIRSVWPEQDEETLRRLHNTNDVDKLAALFADAYNCIHSFAPDGDLIFTKE